MTFYQVFDSGRVCVLNLEGGGRRATGKKPWLIYTTVPAAARSLARSSAVIASLLKAAAVGPQDIPLAVRSSPTEPARTPAEGPRCPLCLFFPYQV